MTPDQLAVALAIVFAAIFVWLILWVRARRQRRRAARPPVDPALSVLQTVIDDLRRRDLSPIVVFDASVGYRIADRFMGAGILSSALGLPPEHVHVVNKGVVADQVLLELAQDHGLRVISNDRYRDWRQQFPGIGKKGATVRGRFEQGVLKWHPAARLP